MNRLPPQTIHKRYWRVRHEAEDDEEPEILSAVPKSRPPGPPRVEAAIPQRQVCYLVPLFVEKTFSVDHR
jgi:hypothetical protein